MADTVQTRKAKLRDKLIALAETQIAKGGAASLRARALAQEAGCAVGAIYTHFDDLDALVLAVNLRTFQRLGRQVACAVAAAQGQGPNDRLIAMAQAYLRFAEANPLLWQALFDVRMTADDAVPQWYLDALGGLFSHIAEPLSELYPDAPEQELDLMTRALFSSVHGIVLLGLQNRISAVPVPQIERMIAQILGQVGNTSIS